MRYIAGDSSTDPRLAEADSLRRSVRSVHRYFVRRMQERVERHGFTLPQMRVLQEVAAHSGTTVTQLANALQMTQSTTSGIVQRLVAKGILERRRTDDDRRAVHLWPAARMRSFLEEQGMEFAAQPVADLLDRLDAETRSSVVRAVHLLAVEIERVQAEESEHATR